MGNFDLGKRLDAKDGGKNFGVQVWTKLNLPTSKNILQNICQYGNLRRYVKDYGHMEILKSILWAIIFRRKIYVKSVFSIRNQEISYFKLWYKNTHYLEKRVVKTYVTVKICSVKRHYTLYYACILNILFLWNSEMPSDRIYSQSFLVCIIHISSQNSLLFVSLDNFATWFIINLPLSCFIVNELREH